MEHGQIYAAFNISIDIYIYDAAQPNDTAQKTLIDAYSVPRTGARAHRGQMAYTNYCA